MYLIKIINNNINKVKYMYITWLTRYICQIHCLHKYYPSQVFLFLTNNMFVLLLIERFVSSHLYTVYTCTKCSVRFFQQINFILAYGL